MRAQPPGMGVLPAWSVGGSLTDVRLPVRWPDPVDRRWAFDRATGRGTRVCVVDSGVEDDHPLVGPVDGAVKVIEADTGTVRVVADDPAVDASGHGTACAGIIRSLAPDCGLYSVRVLGEDATGSGSAMVAGLRWAIGQGFDVINLSMSTRRAAFAEALHDLADSAYFRRTALVASAHNQAVESWPWRFASVISVGSHDGPDPRDYRYNPQPPVEFFGRGADLEVAWLGGSTMQTTGNSFATAHLSGLCALILGKHPGLTIFELKSVLYLTATNVGDA